MVKKQYTQYTLEELEQLLGKEQLDRLFIEHYLMLSGCENTNITVTDGLSPGRYYGVMNENHFSISLFK